MSEPTDFNQRIIQEFRENGGKVGGPFAGGSLLLLHTTGARTGRPHTTPIMYRKDGDNFVVFASFAGRPENPAWFHNLVAHPDVQVEVGSSTHDAVARVAEGAERERLWTAQKTEVPQFAAYEANTTRQIPVVIIGTRS